MKQVSKNTILIEKYNAKRLSPTRRVGRFVNCYNLAHSASPGQGFLKKLKCLIFFHHAFLYKSCRLLPRVSQLSFNKKLLCINFMIKLNVFFSSFIFRFLINVAHISSLHISLLHIPIKTIQLINSFSQNGI